MESRGKKLSGTLRHAIAERFRNSGTSSSENPEQEKYKRLAQCSFMLAVCVAIIVVACLAWWLSTPGGVAEQGGVVEVRCNGVDSGALVGDGEDCSRFWVCEGGVGVLEKCQKYHNFDVATGTCQWVHVATCFGQEGEGEKVVEEEEIPSANGTPSLRQILEKEAELVNSPDIKQMRDGLATLDSKQVELVRAGRSLNPPNVLLVESILSPSDWDHLFPLRAPSYTYDNFLKAVSKFPLVCSASVPRCRQLLATMFAHFAQETGNHAPGSATPEWRQGLAHLEEMSYSSASRGGAYSSNCNGGQWTAKAWPCGRDEQGKVFSYHGRGAKQLSYNYNYGQFSQVMYGAIRPLLDHPELVASTWLNLASALWFFSTPQPPKPSMLAVMEGTWKPNIQDRSSGLLPGFGLTTNIINGGIECGKGKETQQSKNRIKYYLKFADYLKVPVGSSGLLGCSKMGKFGASGSGAVALYWEQNWAKKFECKLVSYVTQYSALLQGDYTKCVNDKFDLDL